MSATHWDTVKALFSAAVELPREDRTAISRARSGR